MDSKETHQEQQQQENLNASALEGPITALSQPQQPFMLEGSPYPVIDDGGENAKRGRHPLVEEGRAFTAHIINVNAGEDIGTKLVAFLNQEPGHVRILTASGTVSSAWLSNNSLGVVKYEGEYWITHMSGTFLNTESHDGTQTITGDLSVSLAGPDFKVVWGFVRGTLVAGSPVQVIVGSSVPDNELSLSGGGAGSPQSQGPQFSSEPSEEDGSESPLLQVGDSTSHLEYWPGYNPQ